MKLLTLLALGAGLLLAQPVSSYRYTVKGDEKTIEITNVNYEFTPANLILRTTTKSKQVIGDIGMEASTTVEAWKVGTDINTEPLYAVTVEGNESRTVEGDLFVISRGLEEVEWWSVYNLANGAHLFDTYVPLVKFSSKRDELIMRYAGFEVPEDDRVKDPHVIGVLSYASGSKLIRSAQITCDDPKQAQLLRSFADETRTLSYAAQTLRLAFSPPALTIVIPIAADNLDLAHAQLPPHVHVTALKP
jgi:hypothetical protein